MLTFAEFERTEIAGVPIIVATRDEAIEQIAAVAQSGGAGDVHLANSYVISLTAQDEDYHRLIASGAAVCRRQAPHVGVESAPGPRAVAGRVRRCSRT